MTDNQHESVARVARYAQHIRDLAEAFGVIIDEEPVLSPDDASAGTLITHVAQPMSTRKRVISISPVIDETTYACALHEMGHCLHPLGMIDPSHMSATFRTSQGRAFGTLRDVRLKIDSERAAWEWARARAIEWTLAMSALETWAMGTYLEMSRQYGLNLEDNGTQRCRTCGANNRVPAGKTVRCGRCKQPLRRTT